VQTCFDLSAADAIYLAGCLAGQALLASGALSERQHLTS
jgi:hypothetical protein